MNKLEITVSRQAEATIIKLNGSADMAEAKGLHLQLEKILQDDSNDVVVDMSGLAFISSMGLSGLIQAHRQCHNQKRKMSLVNLQPTVASVIQTTQLDHLFKIYPSVEAATAHE